jgi:hypothetical protein
MICLVSFVSVLALVLTNFAQADLIGYWRFDESSGTIAADSAGGDNDGILFGDQLEWAAGRFGGALSHGGVWNAGVEILTTGMSATAGTVAMWGVLADPQPAQNKYFFGHTTQPQWANRIQLYMNDGDNFLDLGLGNSHTVDTDIIELPMEEWVHVALTWDSDNYVVYINGEDVVNGTYAGLSDIYPIANIGNNGTSGPDKGFAGLLDEVRLYDYALNAAEILAAMEGVEKVDVTAPGDAIQGVPNDGLHDGSRNFGWWKWESPDLVIDDDVTTKYLHFKGETETTGFQVTPRSGATIVTGLTLTTANDFPARDPIAFELSGSNVGIDGPYEFIASSYIVDFAQEEAWPRLTKNATPISFYNDVAYDHYQVLFPVVRAAGNANSMQIAEVELLEVSAHAGADIILVTEAIDWDMDGLRDDHSLETFLVSEGHSVDVRPDYWKTLDPDKINELNAADLIIFSRLNWSKNYDDGNETTQWNSLTTPLLQMSAWFVTNTRWNWVNSDVKQRTPLIYAEAVDPHHPIFRGVPLTAFDPSNPDSPLNVVQMVDPLIGTGLTSFIQTTNMGNGHLIAKPVQAGMGWIAEWVIGAEFFEGAGQYTGGRRMLFCAGTQETRSVDPDTQEEMTTAQGELNLTDEGLQMFRNAIDYMLRPSPESTESIVAHWKLDEIEGAIAYDSVGDNDGILYGNPIWQPMGGMLDGALEFDGDDDYVDCGTFNPSDATGQLSICLWAKWNGLNGRYQGLIGKRNSWNVNNMMWQLETSRQISGKVMFEREGYAGVSGGILTEGDWDHWCVTFDGATAIIYRMGEEVNRGAFSFGSKTDAQVVLGGSNAANPFNGALDDVRIYDCALDENQIKSLISAPPSLN